MTKSENQTLFKNSEFARLDRLPAADFIQVHSWTILELKDDIKEEKLVVKTWLPSETTRSILS